jgi:hypothetical protein
MALNKDDINLEILIKQNILRVSFSFKYDIDVLYNLFIQPCHYQEIFNECMDEVKCIKGISSLNVIGSEFKMIFRRTGECKLKVEKVIETPTFKLLDIRFSDEPANFRFNAIYKFYKNTAEPLTHFCYEFKFRNPQELSYHQVQFNTSDYINLYNSFNNYVQKKTNLTTEQVESIVIERNINSLWEVLQDWKRFQALAPIIADRIEYKEDKDQGANGALIKLIFEKNDCNIIHVLKVQSSFKNEESAELIVSLLNSNLKSLSQDLVFNLYRLREGQCLLTFKHVFKKIVDNGYLEEFSISKRNILNLLRDNLYCEKRNAYHSCDDNSTLDDITTT